mmetsp:Transcript_25141/g.87720  ORF Transcript_25141/g.87720 Transcript_25141/m.87720 type:complete len:96 (-) Transcript_25141:27-314(-)|eukprot:CAMPEP_0203808464 /NCGR_PEP_ID=MMETSP0115-20131106/1640_1 /ASSEMBLY_ACC=CAM_ASM_000227 /TAXON_ID=33651 /ORGANISM="Bicosoecid sp, Strain ms1" /LENGTH=95 /DNA_ID=CAMNT_0050717153 /DNA_START=33 /DNA_END=320 /DNA_ORIENTATION=+
MAAEVADAIEREVEQLKVEIARLGEKQENGEIHVKFGVLFDDDRCQQVFEALAGTLKAAKKRKVIAYAAPLLLKGAHDNEVIRLLVPPEGEAKAE